MSTFSEIGAIISALATQDSFEISGALRPNGIWYLGALTMIVLGFAVSLLYRAIPLLDRHLERTIMVASYLAIGFIIFWAVIDRFIFNSQWPWSTTIPPFLFMIMAWFGAAYNIRLRTHLSFSEFRTKMGPTGQLTCLFLDFLLWLGFALILFVTTCRVAANSAANFQIVLGTDNTMQWWFLVSAPIAAVLIAGRAIENIIEDLQKYRAGEPLIEQAVIGGDT
ncbi:TRAP transporter small permease subunit [uncultured Roseobacter sp.]|uniref:TRAP transporter small permease n=1 Tax=uncultured Roseobacter sp. TaxID=114847 RepID=UPI002630AA97|nr:TRAP transporter small permease subunit [uncultured Roseobacter sp.]